jgi:hypothetical protein
MNRGIPAVPVLIARALTILPAAAKSQSTSRPHHIVAKAPSPMWAHRGAAIAPQRQIACTVAGCSPVPLGCHPEPQHYFSGMTTGFDTIVCP